MSLLEFEGGFGVTLGHLGGLLWEHLRHMGVTLGLLWTYFNISLGSIWISVGDFGSLDNRLAMIVESLWVHEGPVSKALIFR